MLVEIGERVDGRDTKACPRGRFSSRACRGTANENVLRQCKIQNAKCKRFIET
jgi:hypothetical protein